MIQVTRIIQTKMCKILIGIAKCTENFIRSNFYYISLFFLRDPWFIINVLFELKNNY